MRWELVDRGADEAGECPMVVNLKDEQRRRRPVIEARWFVPGLIELPGGRTIRRRTDRYHLPSLALDRSLKLRGEQGRPEQKVRTEVQRVSTPDGLLGSAEGWIKQVGAPPPKARRSDWIPVAKEIWTDSGWEITRLEVGGGCWWSIAARCRKGLLAPLPESYASLLPPDEVDLWCGSYPSWLLGPIAGSR